MPKEIRDKWSATYEPLGGGRKARNAIVHAIVPKDVTYGGKIQVTKGQMETFRSVTKTVKWESGRSGFTKSEMIGTGMLGSKEALDAAIDCGDVAMETKNGKAVYYIHRAYDGETFNDTNGGKVSTGNFEIDRELLDKLQNDEAASVYAGWMGMLVDESARDTVLVFPSVEEWERFSNGIDQCQLEVKRVKLLCS